jgi:type I restriction enzyme S subunit
MTNYSFFCSVWEQRKLGDVTDSYSGGTPSVSKSEYYGGDIPFIRSAEINSDCTELFLTKDGLKNSSAKMVSKGDILYALYGATSGETGLAKLDGAINQAILDIKPHENFFASFIMQWLRKNKQNIIGTYLQGGQGNLSGAIVTSLMVDIPTFDEQRKIGELFTMLDKTIVLHQRK